MREDWEEVELGQILIQSKDKHKPEKTERLFYVGLEHIEKFTGCLTKHASVSEIKTVKNKFSKGQLLYGKLRPYLNKVHLSNESGVCSTDILVFDVSEVLLGKFALLKMLSRKFVNDMSSNTNGVNLPRVSTKYVNAYPFPLPSLPEQRAIVAKIEELFSDLDKGIADLKKAQAQLKVYRQAVLKKAFDGELTSTEMTSSNLSSLTSIITKGASPKWQGFDYTSDKNQLLFITSENVREGYVSLKKEKYLPVGFNEIQKRSVLQKGDVLFNIVGASIGRAAIFELDKLSNINQAVALIRLNEEVLNQYVNYFLNSEGAKQEYLKRQVEVARANLSLQNVKDIEIPFCNEADQRRVICEIESRLSVCDKVEQTITESLEKSQALRQSILKKAFAGNLLSAAEIEQCKQAPDYEPASVLLAKIKAEKTTKPTKVISAKKVVKK